MEDLHKVSGTYEDESATADPHELVAESSTTINMEMVNSDYHSNMHTLGLALGGETHSQIATTDETTPLFPIPTQFQNYTVISYLIYAASLLCMFPSLIALVGIKFQNKAHSPFETDRVFANMAVVAYIIAILMPIALVCLRARLARESSPPIYYRILQCVLCFWSLLAPLSFVLELFLPHGFGLIGYLTVSTLFVVVVACSFSDYIKLPCSSLTLEARTRNETWSHSTFITITEE